MENSDPLRGSPTGKISNMVYVIFALELAGVAGFALLTSVYVAREPEWSISRGFVLLLSVAAWLAAAFLLFSLAIGLGTEDT